MMQSRQQHIIQKQYIEVEMQDPPDAFSFRNRLGELYYEKIFPRLENLFEEVCPADRYISLDKLVIDAGIIDKANWEEIFVETVLKQLKEELLLKKSTFTVEAKTGKHREPKDERRAETGTGSASGAVEEIIDKKENAVHFIELFIYFLRYGSLSWNAPVMPKMIFEQRIADAVNEEPALFLQKLSIFLSSAGTGMLKRLVYQLPTGLLDKIAVLLLKDVHINHKRFDKLKEIFTPVLTLSFDAAAIKELIYRSFFECAQQPFESASFEKKFSEKIFSALPAHQRHDLKTITDLLVQELTELDFVPSLPVVKPGNDEKVITKKEDHTPPSEFYLYNAGLVLLHPFLLPLFSNAGFMKNEEKKFRDAEAASCAVLLSQYLITGEIEFPEYDLLLNKLLCGLPYDEPVLTVSSIDAVVFEEADSLLAQVIGMWKMNGREVNVSVDGLRSSFLQRPGKLTRKENGWLLQVEQKSYDLVLSSLPWGISIIKNELMKEMLWVEWT